MAVLHMANAARPLRYIQPSSRLPELYLIAYAMHCIAQACCNKLTGACSLHTLCYEL